MKIRTTQPKNNKYYIRTCHGGYSTAIAGDPTIKGADVLCNCVGYAGSRFNEIIGKEKQVYTLTCNAENFIEAAKRQGLKISSTPVQGGIMVWQKGRTLGGGDGAGHVAVVEEVYDDGSILTSESGWKAWAFKNIRRFNDNGRWDQSSAYKFRGCIVNPAVKPEVAPAPKLNVDGIGGAATVSAMQRFFGTPADGVISGQSKAQNKHYPALKAVEYGKGGSPCIKNLQRWCGVTQDGVLGEKTIKAWQKKLDMPADGVFGSGSMTAWQIYLNKNEKAVYPTEPAKPAEPVSTLAEWQKKTLDYAKYLAGSAYHYVRYSLGKKAHECPICHNHKKGEYYGGNCIWLTFACLHHGAGIKCRCSCDAMTDRLYEKILTLSDKEANKLVRDRLKNKNFKVIKSKNGLSFDQLEPCDVVAYFNGNDYKHTALYVGDKKIADCTSGRKDNIKYGVSSYSKWKIKIAIRYTGK